tara:strand:+ start:282 stop:518 length:237 start_codon:yes stop_codon:yes gene_type:complete
MSIDSNPDIYRQKLAGRRQNFAALIKLGLCDTQIAASAEVKPINPVQSDKLACPLLINVRVHQSRCSSGTRTVIAPDS